MKLFSFKSIINFLRHPLYIIRLPKKGCVSLIYTRKKCTKSAPYTLERERKNSLYEHTSAFPTTSLENRQSENYFKGVQIINPTTIHTILLTKILLEHLECEKNVFFQYCKSNIKPFSISPFKFIKCYLKRLMFGIVLCFFLLPSLWLSFF